ncbi:MAG TPA: hypothetical protein VMW62_18895, partial [Chloroflexota bacterium]|nr:hypothetical protein [Chloroflexota bacterium]
MEPASDRHILTINSGSSSLKAALYRVVAENLELQRFMLAEQIGLPEARFHVSDGSGRPILTVPGDLPDQTAALMAVFQAVEHAELSAVGHRVVHGGNTYSQPQRVEQGLVRTLRGLVSIDPLHLPQAIATIEAVGRLRPDIPQVACFDTAFHRSMPPVAQRYPLPRDLVQGGIIRYGFHGLSYEYITEQLRTLDSAADHSRVIVAHLGNGASMAAIRDGHSIETTMGFTPTGGLVMGTRSGDLDPGVLVHLATAE